jgi:aspartyl/asparaginyl-tRNA synthetase
MKNILHYDYMVRKLRAFFQDQKGFVEVPAQSRVSILAACEDPRTVTNYKLGGHEYPLPQTGQMWLEMELLKNPSLKGVFCQTTSYRDEPVIIEGRHHRIFPMFEFESHGDINNLRRIESELLIYLGFDAPKSVQYEDACTKYNVSIIEAAQEQDLAQDISHSLLLERFPARSNPFFNMKRTADGLFNKIDVILFGMETIGSAERSCNIEEMRELFFTTSDGKYAELLFAKFGKQRVLKELDDFLSLPMLPRFGAGIGLTRLETAMQRAGLFDIPTVHMKTADFTQPTL